MQKITFSTIFILSSFLISLDFSDGPYGSEYFDIAGPFELEDLNALPQGDVNDDDILNIQDIILMIQFVIGNVENPDWEDDADVNNDTIVDILDIVLIINMILINEYSIVADVNEDGFVNILDVVIMANILVGGLP